MKKYIQKAGRLYLKDDLQHAMQDILKYPLTFIEAGPGFGKTTAVNEYLENNAPDHETYWHTFLGEPTDKAWKALCALISRAAPATGKYLQKLAAPSLDTLYEITSMMHTLKCAKNTVIVADNYQLAAFAIPIRLLYALSLHGCEKLHIVVISHPISEENLTFAANPHMLHIQQERFVFSEQDVIKWFAYCGAQLSDEEAGLLMRTTDGWAAALRLQMESRLATGCIKDAHGIFGLLESAIWDKLTAKRKKELLCLCLPESFTAAQAAVMTGKARLTEEDRRWLSHLLFCRYDGQNKTYLLHSLLREYLQEKFSAESASFCAEAKRRAADGCAAAGDILSASRFYSEIKEYASLLSVIEKCLNVSEIIWYAGAELFDDIRDNCPAEILDAHPELMVKICMGAFTSGRYELSASYYKLMGEIIARITARDAQYGRALSGELELFKFLMAFNDIPKMCEAHECAWEILRGPAKFLSFKTTWTFGVSSVACMFWRESGKLDQETHEVRAGMPRYYSLTKGHGMGAADAMEADAALLRGEDQLAEERAIRTLYLAEQNAQDSISFCAELTLVRVAILRGDAAKYADFTGRINRRAFESADHYSMKTAELCIGFIAAELRTESLCPESIRNPLSIISSIAAPALPFAHIAVAKYLLDTDLAHFRALIGSFTATTERFHMLLPKVYFLIYTAIEREASSDAAAAKKALNEALDIALPDRVYMPFAENYPAIQKILTEALRERGEEETKKILRLGERLAAGIKKIKSSDRENSDLTTRELQVALLLKDGMTTKAAAAALCMSDSNVRSVKKRIYSKLGIHSKIELLKKDI
ncbi:MAG: LuxR C-terminal-related transcriptional regulator [Cloacibacillus sp.]